MENEQQKKKSWLFSPKGLLLLLFFWPFFALYWLIFKSNWNPVIRLILVAIIIGPGLLVYVAASFADPDKIAMQNATVTVTPESKITQITQATTQAATSTPTPTLSVTLTPTPTSKPVSPTPAPQITEEVFIKLMKEKAKVPQDSFITALKQPDNTWTVVVVTKTWPELFADTVTRNTALNVMRELYNSPYPVKQGGLTVMGPEGRYFRAFLGANHAKTLTKDEWKQMYPTGFNKWMKSIQTSRNEPNLANRTIVEENFD